MQEASTPQSSSKSNIILEDKEMKELVQKLVTKAHDGGFCVSNLKAAIALSWNDQYPTPKAKMTPEQEAFKERAVKFMLHYRDDLVGSYYKYREASSSEIEHAKEGFIDGSGLIYNVFLGLIVAVHSIFDDCKTIWQRDLVNFAKPHFLYVDCCGGIQPFIKDLVGFFYNDLVFDPENTTSLPSVDLSYHCNRLYNDKDFCEFTSKYKYSRTNANKLSMAVMWFFSKYF